MLKRLNVRTRALTLATLFVSSLGLAPTRGEDATTAAAESGDRFVIGTGLVIGLPGTGDSEVDERSVERSIVGVLRHAGIEPWRGEIVPGHIAKVIVTAELQDGGKNGESMTVRVTAVGDATSLAGGTLLPTPLRRTNGEVYVIGQGPVAGANCAATSTGTRDEPQAGRREVAAVEGTVTLEGQTRQLAAD